MANNRMKRKLEQVDNHEIEVVVGHKVDFGSSNDFKKDNTTVAIIRPRQVALVSRKSSVKDDMQIQKQPIIEQNANISTVSVQDWGKTLCKLREKLKKSNKIETILTQRVTELENSISSTRSQLRGLIMIWTQFDEDGAIFRSRIYNKEYHHLANNSIVPPLPHILKTKATFESKAKASKDWVFEVLDGIQLYQDQLDQIYATLQSKCESLNTRFPYLEGMIREDILKIKLDKETFRKFRRAYKECREDHRLRLENAIPNTAENTNKLRDTIKQLEWDISKLQRYDGRLDTLLINLQQTYQSMTVDVQNLQIQRKAEEVAKKVVELDKDNPLLRELEELRTSEELAFAQLQKLRLDSCDIQRDEIFTSPQYRKLEDSVTIIEDFVSKQFLDLEILLSQNDYARGCLSGLANVFERKELEKQAKHRHDVSRKIDQISFTKQYLADWRQDINLRRLSKEYFQPVEKEEEDFAEILQTQHEGFHIYLNYAARKEERLLAERNKLLTVDKEMQQRIRHLTGNKVSSPPRQEIDNGSSNAQPEELVRVKRELAKAQSDRDNLKFQLDLFKNNAMNPNTGPTSVEDSLKKTRHDIENLSKLIRKLKHFTNLKGTESSLMREIDDRTNEMQTLITSLEKCGHNFDQLNTQRNKLVDMISQADNQGLYQYSQNMIQGTEIVLSDKNMEIDKNSDMKSIAEFNTLTNSLPELDEKTNSLVQRISKYQEKLQNLHIAGAHANIENIRLLHTTAIPNVQIDCYQMALDKINDTLKERTDDIAAEEQNQANLLQQIRHTRESIDQIRRQGGHPTIDEVTLEQIRTYKQILMCPSCQNNYKDVIIPNCGHVFCHQCLQQVRECPKCKTALEEGDICKLYLV